MKTLLFWALTLIVWAAGSLGIGRVCAALFEGQDMTNLASIICGFGWGYFTFSLAMYVWGEYID